MLFRKDLFKVYRESSSACTLDIALLYPEFLWEKALISKRNFIYRKLGEFRLISWKKTVFLERDALHYLINYLSLSDRYIFVLRKISLIMTKHEKTIFIKQSKVPKFIKKIFGKPDNIQILT